GTAAYMEDEELGRKLRRRPPPPESKIMARGCRFRNRNRRPALGRPSGLSAVDHSPRLFQRASWPRRHAPKGPPHPTAALTAPNFALSATCQPSPAGPTPHKIGRPIRVRGPADILQSPSCGFSAHPFP